MRGISRSGTSVTSLARPQATAPRESLSGVEERSEAAGGQVSGGEKRHVSYRLWKLVRFYQ